MGAGASTEPPIYKKTNGFYATNESDINNYIKVKVNGGVPLIFYPTINLEDPSKTKSKKLLNKGRLKDASKPAYYFFKVQSLSFKTLKQGLYLHYKISKLPYLTFVYPKEFFISMSKWSSNTEEKSEEKIEEDNKFNEELNKVQGLSDLLDDEEFKHFDECKHTIEMDPPILDCLKAQCKEIEKDCKEEVVQKDGYSIYMSLTSSSCTLFLILLLSNYKAGVNVINFILLLCFLCFVSSLINILLNRNTIKKKCAKTIEECKIDGKVIKEKDLRKRNSERNNKAFDLMMKQTNLADKTNEIDDDIKYNEENDDVELKESFMDYF